jgi:hypothetical protein
VHCIRLCAHYLSDAKWCHISCREHPERHISDLRSIPHPANPTADPHAARGLQFTAYSIQQIQIHANANATHAIPNDPNYEWRIAIAIAIDIDNRQYAINGIWHIDGLYPVSCVLCPAPVNICSRASRVRLRCILSASLLPHLHLRIPSPLQSPLPLPLASRSHLSFRSLEMWCVMRIHT